MAIPFDPGYGAAPFRNLCENYPDQTVYPLAHFRVEWGPIFHRGRLDGSARLVALGQDPSHNENVVRRILVGEAGRRAQGFFAKLGITQSYVMVNTFLYSIYSPAAGSTHKNDPPIVAYRNLWLDALIVGRGIEAVVAFGSLADDAWHKWKSTPHGAATAVAYAHVTHPTQPESSSGGDPVALAAATKAMLANWNTAIAALRPAIAHPDVAGPLIPYGDTFAANEKPRIPTIDLPAGLPDWMGTDDNWAQRAGTTAKAKRANITITVPPDQLP
jgi:hypothetical protein